MGYRRDAFTWTGFGALFAFGYLNAVLGPALPYIRATEGVSYLVGALHQAAFAVGGGIAGALSTQDRRPLGRRAVIAAGLTGAGLAALAVGYGARAPITIAAALLMGLCATLALIRLWAALADAHGSHRAVAMSEGEVAVSLAGIATPVLLGAFAGTGATWRLAFAVGTVTVATAVAGLLRTNVPPPVPRAHPAARHAWTQPTLLIVIAIVGLEFALSFWLASYLDDDVGLPRDTAVALVSVLYAANLAGRLLASRLARAWTPERVLSAALASVLTGLPFLLAATGTALAVIGITATGVGIGALFPITSSLHVQTSAHAADNALGEVLAVAALGQIAAPLLVGILAQATNLRVALFLLPALTLLAATGLIAHRRHSRRVERAPETPGSGSYSRPTSTRSVGR